MKSNLTRLTKHNLTRLTTSYLTRLTTSYLTRLMASNLTRLMSQLTTNDKSNLHNKNESTHIQQTKWTHMIRQLNSHNTTTQLAQHSSNSIQTWFGMTQQFTQLWITGELGQVGGREGHGCLNWCLCGIMKSIELNFWRQNWKTMTRVNNNFWLTSSIYLQ